MRFSFLRVFFFLSFSFLFLFYFFAGCYLHADTCPMLRRDGLPTSTSSSTSTSRTRPCHRCTFRILLLTQCRQGQAAAAAAAALEVPYHPVLLAAQATAVQQQHQLRLALGLEWKGISTDDNIDDSSRLTILMTNPLRFWLLEDIVGCTDPSESVHPISVLSRSVASYLCHFMLTCGCTFR